MVAFALPGEQRAALGGMCLGAVPRGLAAGAPRCPHSSRDTSGTPLRLSPAPSFPTCFYVSAHIDCGTFIPSSVPLQQGILCCEFMAGLCPSLSYLIGQSSCNTWCSQHSCTGSRRERWAAVSPSLRYILSQQTPLMWYKNLGNTLFPEASSFKAHISAERCKKNRK